MDTWPPWSLCSGGDSPKLCVLPPLHLSPRTAPLRSFSVTLVAVRQTPAALPVSSKSLPSRDSEGLGCLSGSRRRPCPGSLPTQRFPHGNPGWGCEGGKAGARGLGWRRERPPEPPLGWAGERPNPNPRPGRGHWPCHGPQGLQQGGGGRPMSRSAPASPPPVPIKGTMENKHFPFFISPAVC